MTLTTPVDKCSNCQGFYIQKGQLKELLDHRSVHQLEVPKYAYKLPDTTCPNCEAPFYEFCYPETMTLIDACKNCESVWLDDAEYQEINSARDAKNQTICPVCDTVQRKADQCKVCGAGILAKIRNSQKPAKKTNGSYADKIPGIKGALLRFIDQAITKLQTSIFR